MESEAVKKMSLLLIHAEYIRKLSILQIICEINMCLQSRINAKIHSNEHVFFSI